jgi:hypothetical protein
MPNETESSEEGPAKWIVILNANTLEEHKIYELPSEIEGLDNYCK